MTFEEFDGRLRAMGPEWYADVIVNHNGSVDVLRKYGTIIGGPGYGHQVESRDNESSGELFARAIAHAEEWKRRQK